MTNPHKQPFQSKFNYRTPREPVKKLELWLWSLLLLSVMTCDVYGEAMKDDRKWESGCGDREGGKGYLD